MKHIVLCIIFYVSLLQKPSSAQSIEDSPFCDICSCENQTVKCSSYDTRLNSAIFDKNYWMDQENKSYPIETFILRSNPLPEINKQFPGSTALKRLDLAGNDIVNISVEVFKNLQSLEVLILSNNLIYDLVPDVFRGLYLDGELYPLKSLKELRLDHNRFHSLNQDLFEHIDHHLERLFLNNNPFEKIDHNTVIAITSLVYLKILDLSYTGISSLPEYFLHTPKFLTTLNLSGNNFTTVPWTLGDSHALEMLNFNNNSFVNLTEESGFPQIKTLKTLHFCNMPFLKNVSRHALSNLTNLEELYLANNPELEFLDEEALSMRKSVDDYDTYPPLKKLYLNNNKLMYLDMGLISKWESLIELDLTENPWICDCNNQWFVDELIPIYLSIDNETAADLKCGAPIEMQGYSFEQLSMKKTSMRCLDVYGARPERDAALLVGILAGILLAIPLVLFIMYSYQRNWYGLCDNSPASFSRQFYARTDSKDVYYDY